MHNSIQSPASDPTSEIQSLIGQVFEGTVSEKKDDSLSIAIADPHGTPFPVPGNLPKWGMIGFTQTIKDQRFALLNGGEKLFVRVVAIDTQIAPPVVQLVEASSLR